jgi:CHASE2 domain-containing sensor protein/tRNA A-37 threonylcarbamoyl transferase component Bud32
MTFRKVLLAAGGTVLLIGALIISSIAGIDGYFYRLNFLSPSQKGCDSVVIVGIDPSSVATVGAWPWPRGTQARLIDAINAGNPSAIALDFLFQHNPDSIGSDSLVRAFGRTKGLVLPFRIESFSRDENQAATSMPSEIYRHRFLRVINTEALQGISFYSVFQAIEPDSLFARLATHSGFINISTRKGTQELAEVIHAIKAGNEVYPSFGIAAVAAYLGLKPEEFALDGKGDIVLGNRRVPISSYAASALVHYRGPSGAIRTIPAADVIAGKVDPRTFSGKLVFVGITDPAVIADFLITPVGSDFPGVEVWATVASDILQKKWINTGGIAGALSWLLVLLLFPGLVLATPSRFRIPAIVAGGVIASGSVGLMFGLFSSADYFWNPFGHLCAWMFGAFWLGFQKPGAIIVRQGLLDFDSRDQSTASTLPPPGASDFLAAIPETETASHAAAEAKKIVAARADAAGADRTMVEHDVAADMQAEAAVLDQLRRLCNGQIVKLLGSGGMADVYLIWNPRLEVYRAVKVIKPGRSEKLSERFETEVKILSNLSHTNIVQCYSAGDWFGLSYLEMEYIHGVSTDTILEKSKKFSIGETLAIGILVCRALHHAHQKIVNIYGKTYNGVIHRDLKPANIMVARNGQIKLTDFGIARPAEVHLHTVDTGTVVGTLPYLAPEQIDGREIDARTDIYALGVTLYEFLTGERALPQTEVTALLSAKSTGNIKPIHAVAGVPPDVAKIINKAIAVSPAERYSSAADMAKDLEKVFSGMVKTEGWKVLEVLTGKFWG